MEKKIIKKYGGCEITISFKEKSVELPEKIKWLLIESYCDRVNIELTADNNTSDDLKAA